MLVTNGNRKLGKVKHTNLTPGRSCPGASEWCRLACYAQKANYLWPAVVNKYAEQTDLLETNPGAYETQLALEVAKLKPGEAFRFHTAGDIMSAEHARIIGRIVASRPDVWFYLYTRSYRDAEILAVLLDLASLPNLTIWASTDPTLPAPPDGFREARVFDTAEDARAARFPICPEQQGRKATCSDCGLCWNAKPGARLGFVAH